MGICNAIAIGKYSAQHLVKTFSAKSLARNILFWSCLLTLPAPALELWVSPYGSDQSPGSPAKPFASVAGAQQEARELRRLSKVAGDEPVKIILRAGVYPLTTPLGLRPEDSGTTSGPTVIAAAPGEKPVLSGGVE